MHDYPFDVTTVRLAVIIGVLLTTIFYERSQLTTGGSIVPGYLALFLPSPLFIVVTLITAYLTFFIVNRILSKRFILYGRRKFEIVMLTGLGIHSVFVILANALVGINPLFMVLYGIGFLVPAIIAHDMFRQGACKTSVAIVMSTAIVGVFVYVIAFIVRTSFLYSHVAVTPMGVGDVGYARDLLLAGIVVSVLAGMLVFHFLELRTGGFVTGAYLALMLLRPLDVAFALGTATLTYLFVTHVLMKYVLAFGRRKVALMVVTAAGFAWGGEILLGVVTERVYIPWRGFHVITLMVPALIANDAERQGLYKTFWGVGLTTLTVFTTLNLMDAVRIYFQV